MRKDTPVVAIEYHWRGRQIEVGSCRPKNEQLKYCP
jgi:hypothetical protein